MSTPTYLLLFILFLTSCSNKKNYEAVLQEEYNQYKILEEKSDKFFEVEGLIRVNNFLDSIEQESKESYISSYAEILRTKYIENHGIRLIELEKLKNSEVFIKGSPHIKFLIQSSYNPIYSERRDYNVLLESILESIGHIEPYSDIYYKELANSYEYSAKCSYHFLFEKEKSKKFRNKALKLATDHKITDYALRFLYNKNVPLLNENDELQETINQINEGEVLSDSLINIEARIKKNASEILKHISEVKEAFNEKGEVFEYDHFIYNQIRHAYSKLKQFEKIKELDSEILLLYEEGIFSESQYMYYLMSGIKDDIDNRIKEGSLEKLEKFQEYHKTNMISYGKFRLFTKWHAYSEIYLTVKEELYYIDKSYYWFKKNFEETGHIADFDLNYLIRLLKKSEEIIEDNPSLANLISFPIRDELNLLYSFKYIQLKKESNAFKSQLNYLSEQQIKYAENKLKLEKTKSKTISSLLILSTISLVVFGALSILLIKKNKLIKAQKQEIELITNSVPIGLCKVDKDYNLLWGNNAFNEYFSDLISTMNVSADFKDSTINLFRRYLKEMSYKAATEFEVGVSQDLKLQDTYMEGINWLKFYYIPVHGKNKTKESILLIDDRTKEKQDEVLLINQKNKIEANLKNNLMVLASNFNMIEELKDIISSSVAIDPNVKKKLLRSLSNKNNKAIIENIDFEFQKTEEEFYNKLSNNYPQLTTKNLKLCSYIRLGLSVKEIASLLFVTPASLKMARSRLRNKLNVPQDAKLESFLNSV